MDINQSLTPQRGNKTPTGREPANDAQMGVIERAVNAGRLETPAGWPTIDKFSASQLI
jgi:hypothetical protein